MFGHHFPSHSVRRPSLRILASLAAVVALLALRSQAMAAPAPVISLGASPFSVTPVAVNTLGVSFITLANTGNAELTGISYSVSTISGTPFSLDGYGPAQGYVAGTCHGVTTLAQGSSCTIQVDFMPKQPGLVETTLTVSDNAANSPQTVTILGNGLLGQLQFYPAWLSPFAGVIGLGNGCHDTGNGAPATSATLCTPGSVAADPYGNIYIVDTGKNVVRMVNSSGNISDFAGYASTFDATNPSACGDESDIWGDGCPALDATLNDPVAVAVDAQGNVYISDYGTYSIRVVNAVTGVITKFYSSGPGDEAFLTPGGLAFDPSGNLYVATFNEGVVVKITPSGGGSIFAGIPPDSGGTHNGYNGDGILATAAELNAPNTVASDLSGNIYIADSNNYRIRMVSAANGKISTFAGNGTQGDSGDGGPAIDAEINAYSVAVDAAGEVYVSGNQDVLVRKVDLSGNMTTIAGGGSGSVVPAQATGFGFTSSIEFIGIDLYGDLMIPSGSGVVSAGPQGALVFGSTNLGSTSPALSVTLINTGTVPVYFYNPAEEDVVPRKTGRVAVKAQGVTPDGTGIGGGVSAITGDFAIAAGGTCALTTSGSIAAGASCTVDVTFTPTQTGSRTGTLSFDVEDSSNELSAKIVQLSGTGAGAALIAQVINFTPPTSPVTYSSGLTIPLVATGGGSGNPVVFTMDGASTGSGSITGSTLNVGGVGTFVIDANQTGSTTYSAATQVQQSVVVTAPATAPAVSISPSTYVFPATTVESGYQSGNGNPAITLTNTGTGPLAFTGSTPFTIVNAAASSPISVYPNGSCTETYVDFGTSLPAGDPCTITVQFWPQTAGVFQATLSVADNAADSPQTVLLSGVGKMGQLQFAPARLNASAGAIGNGNACADTGNGSAATSAQLCTPSATVTDMNGNIYIADPGKNVVRVVNSSGTISDFAGGSLAATCVATGSGIGDGCAAINATLNQPSAVAVDGFGNVYISDTGNARVRVVNAVTGIIGTYAGNGTTGTFAAGTATGVPIVPNGIALDQSDNLYIADAAQNIVIRVTPAEGGASAYATVFAGGKNDGAPMFQIALSAPNSVAVDLNGDIYIADTGNNLVRELVNTGDGYAVAIVAGTGTAGNTGDGGAATSAEIYADGVAVDAAGDLYISTGTSIRMVNLSGTITTLAGGGSGSTLPAQAIGVGLSGIGLPGIDLAGDVLIPSGAGVAMAGPQGDLVFGSTNVNSTSSALTVTLFNTGNAPVYFFNPNNAGVVLGARGRAASNAREQSGAAVAEATGIGGGVGTVTGDFAIAAGGTCNLTASSSIPAGASCTVNVTFSPTQSGVRTGSITLYAEGPYAIPAVIQLSGTGLAPITSTPTINWTPATPITYGTALGSGDFAATATNNSSNISADGVFAYYVTSVGGTAATAGTILPGGSNTLCVQWTPSGDFTSEYNSASLCVPITVNAAATAISWTPASPILSPAPLGSGQFNAAASAGTTNVSADGTLVYYVGPVSGGVVATTSTVLPVGSDQLCVQWTPSSSYTADYNASSLCANITVNGATFISWTPASPITYPATLGSGQFNAAASSGTTNISSDGTFTYYVGSVGGTVATTSTILPGGSDTLCVQWAPSSSYSSQYSSATLCSPITVNAASTAISWSPSSTSIIASTGPTAGQFDATAMAGAANITADGALTYHLSTAGGTQINVGATLSVGPATICAVWAPSSGYALDYSGSSACQSFTVINTQPTTTTLTANNNPVFSTNSVTFTATVTPTTGALVPTGTVTFYDDGTPIGTGTLSPSGTGASAIAQLATASLATGSQAITASYPGDTNNQASAATALTELVEDFSIVASGSTSGAIEPGTSASFTFTVSPVAPATTFPAAIALTVAGLPTGANASFSPISIASGAGSTTVTLTVTAPITTLARNLPPGRAPAPAQGAKWPMMALALLLLPLAGRFRRAGRGLSRMLSLLLLFAAGLTAAAALNGCGGIPTGYFGQASSTSSITVTAASGLLSHKASVSLTVE